MTASEGSLDDKYSLVSGAAYMTGIQALVRLPIEQMLRDSSQGLKTGCLISGYEGSPLGGYDIALQRAGNFLSQHGIHFFPGVNEELALTAVMGSQVFQKFPDPRFDGAVGIWYGKGPGLDRSGDALRHANFAGTGENCGALALAGDDHVSKSSTIPHQSELSLYSCAVPILSPSNTQEVLDLGIAGIAMSRFSGAWSALKLPTDLCDGGGIVEFGQERASFLIPELEIDGEAYRKVMATMLIVPYSLSLETEVHEHRLQAAKVFVRENGINRITVRTDGDRLGIVSAGKSYADLMSALRLLGVSETELASAGVRLLRLGMTYPLEPGIVNEFAHGLENILVIEEKRSFVELQIRELLYNQAARPLVTGKRDMAGKNLLPSTGELEAGMIALVLCRFIDTLPHLADRLPGIQKETAKSTDPAPQRARTPSYCSGCPHNRSTLLLEGQIAGGGIGCHGMAGLMKEVQRGIEYIFQMGGEGAAWIGAAPFSGKKHIFQNLGDGTYFHSGKQAVQAAISAGSNITFKILYNHTVAMTGGQEPAGVLSVPAMTHELAAQGVQKIVLLSDEPDKYSKIQPLASMVELRSREDLEDVLAEIEQVEGVTILIYDQFCAAEKRRHRSRGLLPQPERRILINERACEGCGDCVSKANCVSLLPVDTQYGPKTRVHQSSCNADYTCTWGDCPSFVSVMIEQGSGLCRKPLPELPSLELPEPVTLVSSGNGYHILMPGVGGTGVVTINALLATAAQLDGLYAITLDQTGVAQKGGAVVSHLTISKSRIEASQRIPFGCTDLLLGFDLVGAAYEPNLSCCNSERTAAIVNSKELLTGEAIRKGLTVLSPDGAYLQDVRNGTRNDACEFINATTLAESLFGGHIYCNMFLVGVAFQRGLLPLSRVSIMQAIRMNGVAVKRNLEVFTWGRQYALAPEMLDSYLSNAGADPEPEDLNELIDKREIELTAYQNATYAAAYRSFVERVRAAEMRVKPSSETFTRAVAWNLHKLMAYKDEYEVARLLTDPAFENQVKETYEKPVRLIYHLHPPLLRSFGIHKKISFGPWLHPFLKLLAHGKRLRGSVLDPFGWLPSRSEERALIEWYRQLIENQIEQLDVGSLDQASVLADAPREIRGYEKVKQDSIEQVKAWVEDQLQQPPVSVAA